jgi:two-component system, OmpR family, response regulator CpxR
MRSRYRSLAMSASPILVIDDDAELCALLSDYLGNEGFTVETIGDGRAGLERALRGSYGLVVLDVMLPSMQGLDVLRAIRAVSTVPVLMLTARGDDVDRIVGLEIGADDYLGKPFNPRELVARIRAVQRRAERPSTEGTRAELVVGDVTIQPGTRRVARAGEELSLTSVEYALLEVFLRSAGRVVDREELSEKVLGRRFSPYDRSIDVHVSNLRKKLGPDREGRDRIKTVRGTGYLFASA